MEADIIYVKGKLPFILQLEDSIDENGKGISGKEIPIKANNGATTCGLFFKKCIRKDNIEMTVPTEDFFGEFTYSEFFVVYTQEYTVGTTLHKIFYNEKNRYDLDLIADYTTDILNKFVEIYKVELSPKKDWIPYLTKERIGNWNIVVFDKKGLNIASIQRLEYRGTGEMIGVTISDDKLKVIKDRAIQTNVRLKPAVRFMQQANRNFRIGDYLLCALFIQFYFEKWAFEALKYHLLKSLQKEEIDLEIINSNGKYIHYYKAIEKILGNRNFKNSIEYLNFEQNVTNIRDEIVHRERDSVSKDEALLAENAALKFIDYLTKEIKNIESKT